MGNVAQPVFDGMTLLNKQRAAEAGLEQAEAQYRGGDQRLSNVADTLRALNLTPGPSRKPHRRERRQKIPRQIRSQQNFGGVSQLAVVDAQRTLLSTAMTRASRSPTSHRHVALFVALGGGCEAFSSHLFQNPSNNALTPSVI